MTTLFEQLDATRTRIAREEARLELNLSRARRALGRALDDEKASWQAFVTGQEARVSAALAALKSRAGVERAVLSVAERRLAVAHASVRSRLARIDRELAASNTEPATAERPAVKPALKPAARARRAKKN